VVRGLWGNQIAGNVSLLKITNLKSPITDNKFREDKPLQSIYYFRSVICHFQRIADFAAAFVGQLNGGTRRFRKGRGRRWKI
jgi:hypothetical protein